MATSSTISVTTADGATLAGTLFQAAGEGPAVLISSAAAVERRFYAPFAERLIGSGASAVLTYDYRGVGGSAAAGHRSTRMKEWGILDFPAALATLEAAVPGRPVVGLGHSYGGLALGLSGVSERFDRYVMVATLNGYFRRTDEPLSVYTRMNLLGVPVTYLLGRIPGRLGLGTTLPGQVFRDWARWCRDPDFIFADRTVPETARFADVRLPLLSVAIADDRWGTARAVSALLPYFPAAELSEMTIAPQPPASIGHLGLFRRGNASHWPALAAFLLNGQLPATATSGRQRRAA